MLRQLVSAAVATAVLTVAAPALAAPNFGPPLQASIGPMGNGSNLIIGDIASGDLNGDGHPDIVETSSEYKMADELRILINDGHGGFLPAKTVLTAAFPDDLTIGDVDGDGKADVVVDGITDLTNSPNSGQIQTFRGDGAGGLTALSTIANPFSALGFKIADVNGDGIADLISLRGGPIVALGTGGGAFATPTNHGPSPTAANQVGYVGEPALADFNGDGHLDVLAIAYPIGTGTKPSGVTALLGSGDNAATFTAAPITPVPPDTSYATTAAAGDLNGDGKADAVAANFTQNNIAVLLGNGDGTFQPSVAYGPIGVGPNTIKVLDIDGDGHQDVVVACLRPGADYTLGRISVLLGDGAGHLGPATDYGDAAFNPDGGLIATDLNGDAKPDLAFSYLKIAPTGPSTKTLELLETISGQKGLGNVLGGVPATLTPDANAQVTIPLTPVGVALSGKIGLQQTLATKSQTTRVSSTIGPAPPVFAKASYALRASAHKRPVVKLKLTATARTALATKGKIRAAVEITLRPKGHAPQTVRRYVTLVKRRH